MTASILIVDDNPDIAFMTREKLLHFIGGDIRIVLDGPACLERVRNDPPDLVLLDICMPDTDGFEVCRLLKADPRTREVPVIFLSATYDDLRSKIKGYDLGAEDFLVQPIDDLELVTRVKSVLRIKQLQDDLRTREETLATLREKWDNFWVEAGSCCRAIAQECETSGTKTAPDKSLAHIKEQNLRLLGIMEDTRYGMGF